MRWKWFYDDEYEPKPWDTRTERSAPVATDAPELEAFLAAIEKDFKNPELRRKVKSNLNQNQLSYIKEVKTEYPRQGIRVRREDKGARFVIEDDITEDNRIVESLSNPLHFSETDQNPIEGYKNEIVQWGDDALANGEIDEKQHKYVLI